MREALSSHLIILPLFQVSLIAFSRLIRFESATDGKNCFADIDIAAALPSSDDGAIDAYISFENLTKKENLAKAVVGKVA